MSTLVTACVASAAAAACSATRPAPPPLPTPRIGRTEILPAPLPPALPLEDGSPISVVDPRPLTRVLRGDFEPPDTLVVAYEEDWADSLQQIVQAAAGQTRVLLLTARSEAGTPAFERLTTASHVDVLTGDFDSPWVRDYGPLQTYELATGPLWLDFGYVSHRLEDDRVPDVLSARLHYRVENSGFELDGGAVISNGQGLCALTRRSLLDAGFADLEADGFEVFLGSLGCHATTLLPEIPGEPTGHADVVAQFLATDLAMVAWLDPGADAELSLALDRVADDLAITAQRAGYPLQIVRIPIQISGDTFFSYVNATRLRTRLLVPRFNELSRELERAAYTALATALPEVAIVPIDADLMVRLGGAIHCITLGLGPTLDPPFDVQRARFAPRAPVDRAASADHG